MVHRQRLLWDAKLQSLSKHFKMPKDADKKARGMEASVYFGSRKVVRNRKLKVIKALKC